MANNTEHSSAGLKRQRLSSDEPAQLPSGSHSKLDSTIESILRKKVGACQDSKKSRAALMARIKLLEHHAAEGTIPKGLRIRNVKAKGNNETLQAKFDDIIREAEVKLLDAAMDSLRRDVEANQDELREREDDIDGTIAQWRTYLARNKEITSEQADTLVQTAVAFAETSPRTTQSFKPRKHYKRKFLSRKVNYEKVWTRTRPSSHPSSRFAK